MLSLDTAYRSFGGEVEASSTPTICRLPDSCRHQLSAIAQDRDIDALNNSLFRSLLTHMMEDPRNISSCTHLLHG